jgi:CheY-like chemotaxis protein
MRVLFVEDNDFVRGTVREMLKVDGWSVEVCENSIAALEKIESEVNYDLILTDYDLPDGNGVELVRRARQLAHRQRTPIIMFTASPVDNAAYAAGVNQFLRKPEDTHRIIEIAHRLINS